MRTYGLGLVLDVVRHVQREHRAEGPIRDGQPRGLRGFAAGAGRAVTSWMCARRSTADCAPRYGSLPRSAARLRSLVVMLAVYPSAVDTSDSRTCGPAPTARRLRKRGAGRHGRRTARAPAYRSPRTTLPMNARHPPAAQVNTGPACTLLSRTATASPSCATFTHWTSVLATRLEQVGSQPFSKLPATSEIRHIDACSSSDASQMSAKAASYCCTSRSLSRKRPPEYPSE